jgi:hypothetical protein
MRTVVTLTNVYKFHELTPDQQGKVFEKQRWWNVDDRNWWEWTYEDAERIGMKIEAFDFDRANYLHAKFTLGFNETARLIIKDHGKECNTYKIAQQWFTYKRENNSGENEVYETHLRNEYLDILRKEHEYLTSDDVLREMFADSEYEFTVDGELN